MKLRERTKAGILGLAALAMLSYNGYSKDEPEAQNVSIQTRLERAIKEQERVIGIRHYGLPHIEMELPDFQMAKSWTLEEVVMGGSYSAEEDKIILYPIRVSRQSRNAVSDGPGAGNSLRIVIEKALLDHELGHFFNDQLMERLGKGSWPVYDGMSPSDKAATKLISEGIAQYFQEKMSGKMEFSTGDYFTDSMLLRNAYNSPYEVGSQLVTPIIDRYGKAGIEYLLTHLPTAEDLDNMDAYQRKVMEALEGNK